MYLYHDKYDEFLNKYVNKKVNEVMSGEFKVSR